MKATAEKKQIDFAPIALTLLIENQEELDFLYDLSSCSGKNISATVTKELGKELCQRAANQVLDAIHAELTLCYPQQTKRQ